jgi:hypothetical protein
MNLSEVKRSGPSRLERLTSGLHPRTTNSIERKTIAADPHTLSPCNGFARSEVSPSIVHRSLISDTCNSLCIYVREGTLSITWLFLILCSFYVLHKTLMKRILISVLAALLPIVSILGQSFEGKITYQNSYVSKMPNMTNDQFTSMMGTTMEYLIKGGYYRTTMNGKLLEWQLYNNKDNKLYTKMANSYAVLWNDASASTDEVIKAEVNKEVVNILGYLCDELILTCKSGIQKYYYNSKLPLLAKLYENHKFGNWYEFASRSNSIPLKIIIDNPQFTLESVATAVKKEKVDDKIFELPADTKLQKSSY